jgi:tetratricopeptide (TPR) repeat protein
MFLTTFKLGLSQFTREPHLTLVWIRRTVLVSACVVLHLRFAGEASAQQLDWGNPFQLQLEFSQGSQALTESESRLALKKAEAAYALGRDVAIAAVRLGSVLLAQGNLSESKEHFEHALRIVRTRAERDKALEALALNGLGALYWRRADYRHAASLFEMSVDATSQYIGPTDLAVSKLLSNLAVAYASIGDNARAEISFKRALSINERIRGVDDPSSAPILVNLALVHTQRKNWSRAESVLLRARSITERSAVSSDPLQLKILNNLGMVYYERRSLAAAESAFRSALERLDALGPTDATRGIVYSNLADVLSARGDYQSALAFYSQSIDIQEKSVGTRNGQFAKTLERFAQLLRKIHANEEAECVAARAKMIRAELSYTVTVAPLK